MIRNRNMDEMWLMALRHLTSQDNPQSSRDGGVSGEVVGFAAELQYPLNNVVLNPVRKFSLYYACAEVLWYLSGLREISMIQYYAPQYERFSEDGVAYGAYGYRWANNPGFLQESASTDSYGMGQLQAVVEMLAEKPDSRQAVITMWDSGDLIHADLGDHKDLPCTLALQFLVRSGRLHMIATMRSNDVWLGLPYDVFAFTTLQALIARELQLDVGTYHHQAGSEHLYSRNRDKAKEAILFGDYAESYPGMVRMSQRRASTPSIFQQVQTALSIELSARHNQWTDENIMHNLKAAELDPILHDLVLGCATKWTAFSPDLFINPIYRLLTEQRYHEAGYHSRSC